MSDKAVDRRVRKTKKLLEEGLTKLMAEKSVKDITVRELAELVDINRGTFYLHYKDVFDMVEQLQQELFLEFHEAISKHSPKTMGGDPQPMLRDIFHFVAANDAFCLVMLGPNGDMAFVERFKELLKHKCLKEWPEIFNVSKAEDFEYFYAFIVSGTIGLIYDWLAGNRKVSAEQMAVIVGNITLTGVEMLK